MRKLVLLILLSTNFVLSQSNSTNKNKEYKKDTVIGKKFDYVKPVDGFVTSNDFGVNDKEPTFKKCKGELTIADRRKCFSDIFYDNIQNKIRIKKIAKQNEKLDLVVKFTLHKSGKITNIEFLKSNDKSGYFEREVIRIINKLPKFEPGIKDGKLVSVTYSFPIKLTLE
uniref:energy transducer TonB n=1 Tax=Gelidibacter sp. TaxID=2018083 RepID=UPI0040490549